MTHSLLLSGTSILSIFLMCTNGADAFLSPFIPRVPSRSFGLVPQHVPPSVNMYTRTILAGSKSKTVEADDDEIELNSTHAGDPMVMQGVTYPLQEFVSWLDGEKGLAGVYALLNSDFQEGVSGWEKCEHIGISNNLGRSLSSLVKDDENKDGKLGFVRIVAFDEPSEGAMLSIADNWRREALKAGGKINLDASVAEWEVPDDHDEDDEEDMDGTDMEFMKMTAEKMDMATGKTTPPLGDGGIVSPFAGTEGGHASTENLPFTKENVERVLDKVRPALISDGGNVSLIRIDSSTRSVHLKLQGACGTCPSSKVTMQMGIERTLKEHFTNLGEVVQVDALEHALDKVAAELIRINPAITAMGATVEIGSVDGDKGIVELKFRGTKTVKQGIQLAIQDLDFVNEVRFIDLD